MGILFFRASISSILFLSIAEEITTIDAPIMFTLECRMLIFTHNYLNLAILRFSDISLPATSNP